MIKLNDILHLTQEELSIAKVKFNVTNDSGINPLNVWLKNPEDVNHNWLFWYKGEKGTRSAINFSIGDLAACFVRLGRGEWLLTTVKTVTEKDSNAINAPKWSGVPVERLEKYFGRLIVKYYRPATERAQNKLSDIIERLEVVRILDSSYDGPGFSGFDNVRLSFEELEIIVNRGKSDWVGALSSQKAVYLITDLLDGKLYVGSATSNLGMLLARWSNYIANGHGCNKLLREIIEKNGFDYVKKNFQYSILESYNQGIDDTMILLRESWWKEVLGSRAFGLNAN